MVLWGHLFVRMTPIEREEWKMTTFPTTLREITANLKCFHVYGEFNGCRYYVESALNYVEANKLLRYYKQQYSVADWYIRSLADSTQIDGDWEALKAACKEAAKCQLHTR